MVRVTNGLRRQRRHAKFRKMATGFQGGRSKVYKQIRLALVKQGQHAYVGRKIKKRQFRALWIERLSAALRGLGHKYSTFFAAAYQKDMQINRKALSNVAVRFPAVFAEIVSHTFA